MLSLSYLKLHLMKAFPSSYNILNLLICSFLLPCLRWCIAVFLGALLLPLYQCNGNKNIHVYMLCNYMQEAQKATWSNHTAAVHQTAILNLRMCMFFDSDHLEDKHLPSEEGHSVEVAVTDVGFAVPRQCRPVTRWPCRTGVAVMLALRGGVCSSRR